MGRQRSCLGRQVGPAWPLLLPPRSQANYVRQTTEDAPLLQHVRRAHRQYGGHQRHVSGLVPAKTKRSPQAGKDQAAQKGLQEKVREDLQGRGVR